MIDVKIIKKKSFLKLILAFSYVFQMFAFVSFFGSFLTTMVFLAEESLIFVFVIFVFLLEFFLFFIFAYFLWKMGSRHQLKILSWPKIYF